jgi:coenzyme F420-reducing hydrogenase beta subunit
MPELAKYKDCTGCMACVDSCSQSALFCSINDEGHLVPALEGDKCIQCGICEKACPIVSKFPYTESPLANAYASWAADEEIRYRSATAGAFAALAQKILSECGYVCGAAIVDGLHVKHICIDNEKDLHLLQGSKYSQSDATGIYKTVYNHLKSGAKVLFSGTGCQVAGLYGFLGKRKYEGILYTVDLICGGVPSRLLIDKFVENEPYKTARIISFRSKEGGWSPKGFKYNLKVEDHEGRVHDYTSKRNLVTTGFACEMTNRYSCYECKFAGANRKSDFTIGDYWGVADYQEQHYNGVSVIIAHNEKADLFLHTCNQYLITKNAEITDILSHNRRLAQTKDKRYIFPERKFLSFAFRKLSYKTLCKIYAFDFDNKSPWMLYKVYRAIITKLIN